MREPEKYSFTAKKKNGYPPPPTPGMTVRSRPSRVRADLYGARFSVLILSYGVRRLREPIRGLFAFASRWTDIYNLRMRARGSDSVERPDGTASLAGDGASAACASSPSSAPLPCSPPTPANPTSNFLDTLLGFSSYTILSPSLSVDHPLTEIVSVLCSNREPRLVRLSSPCGFAGLVPLSRSLPSLGARRAPPKGGANHPRREPPPRPAPRLAPRASPHSRRCQDGAAAASAAARRTTMATKIAIAFFIYPLGTAVGHSR